LRHSRQPPASTPANREKPPPLGRAFFPGTAIAENRRWTEALQPDLNTPETRAPDYTRKNSGQVSRENLPGFNCRNSKATPATGKEYRPSERRCFIEGIGPDFPATDAEEGNRDAITGAERKRHLSRARALWDGTRVAKKTPSPHSRLFFRQLTTLRFFVGTLRKKLMARFEDFIFFF